MLHRLFNSTPQRHSTEAELKSHALLHGNRSEANINLGGHDVRLIIAQDLGEKAKVVLYDSRSLDGESKLADLETTPSSFSSVSSATHRPKRAEASSTARPAYNHAELITELMFGTVPLSYRGTSVRVHPLPMQDSGEDKRSFLFTKVFTVSMISSTGSSTSPGPSTASGGASLSSSYGSVSALREYPFPSMTPINDQVTSPRPSTQEFGSRDRGHSLTRCARYGNAPKNPQRTGVNSVRSHRRDVSSGAMSESGDVAPHVPFTKSEPAHTQDEHFSGWLPSPGPILSRRRRSVDTNASTSPGPQVSGSRYQPAICAIGVVFTIPGNGQEDTECALLTRYWQMVSRATYALQRVVYDEIELALKFITANGTAQTPRSRARMPKGESQVYQRGRKYYVALGQSSLSVNHKISTAVDVFRARLVGGINLPEILRKPLHQDADVLIEELAWTIDALDRKETKFVFSTLMSLLVDFTTDLRRERRSSSSTQKNSLRRRLLIVSDNVVLARRFIFCIARLFFRDHTNHLESGVDYALVWPSTGLLGLPRRDLLRRRQSSLAKATRLNHGWDIPGNTRPLSSGSYHMPPISPSIYHRPPSTTSNNSSRASSWRPSWSWFANGSRSHLGTDEQCRSNRSDSRTLQTSWNSADFADLVRFPKEKSPRSWSPNRGSNSNSPDNVPFGSEGTATDDDDEESESVETTLAGDQIVARKNEDGSVEVSGITTASLLPLAEVSEDPPCDEAQSGFPLTGVLSRFHPDMLLQAIPQNAYNDSQLKSYLAEEDLYIHDTVPASVDSWTPMADIVIAELGNAWRVRRLTRLTRTPVALPMNSASEPAAPLNWSSDEVASTQIYQETWSDETVTEIKEDLISGITKTIQDYRETKNTACIQHLLNTLPSFAISTQ